MIWDAEFISPDDHNAPDYKWMLIFHHGSASLNCYKKNVVPIWRFGGFVSYYASTKLFGHDKPFNLLKEPDLISNKVWIFASECSPLGYSYQTKYQKPLFRDAEVVKISKSGHFPSVDNPEELIQKLKGVLELYQ